MPTPQDPLGLGDLPNQQPAQGGFGTTVVAPPSQAEQDRQAYAWTQATRSVPPAYYEDRNAYWEAKRQIERQKREMERQRRIQEQEERRLQEERERAILASPTFAEDLKNRLSGENLAPGLEHIAAINRAEQRPRLEQLRQLEQGFLARGYDPEMAKRLAQSQYETNTAERPGLRDAALVDLYGADIPGYSPIARGVRGVVENVAEPVLEAAYGLTPAAQAPVTASGESEAENAAQRGATVTGAFVPVTAGDVVLEAVPGIGTIPGVLSAVAARQALRNAPEATRAARVAFDIFESAEIAAEHGGVARPYANAPDEVVRAHADQGVNAAKQELARRSGETTLFSRTAPPARIPEAIADDAESVDAYKALQQARETRPVIKHYRGRPIRVADHSGMMPQEFITQVSKRAYQGAFADALSDSVERIDQIGQQFFHGRVMRDEVPVNWRNGRFAGTTVDPRAMALNESGLDDAFTRLANTSDKTALPLSEFSGRLVYFNPYAIFDEMTQLIPRLTRTKAPTAQMRTALRQAADMAVADIVHEIVHNGVRQGLPSHGEQFVALQTRLHGHARKEIEQLATKMRRVATRLLDDKEFWDDFTEYQGWATRSRNIQSEVARTSEFAGTVPPPGSGDAGVPADAGRGAGDSGEGVPGSPGMAGAAVPGLPPNPPMGGAAVTPGAQPPPDPVEILLRAKTSEDAEIGGWLRRTTDTLAGLREYFSKTARTERAAEREVAARTKEGAKNIIVRYAGRIQQSIPRETGIEARELRREMGAATQDQLRSMTGALDDFDDSVRQRFLDNLNTEQKLMYVVLRKRIDAMGDLLVARGLLDPEKRRDNYFTHILDFSGEGRSGIGGGGGLRTPIKKPKKAIITGKRTQETLSDDIVKGYTPVTLDPFKIYEHFMVEARVRLAMADILDDIRTFDPEGVMFLKAGANPPQGYQRIHHPMFEQLVPVMSGGDPKIVQVGWAVRDNVAGYINALIKPSAVRENPVGRALLTGTSSVKRTVLGGPLDINFGGFMIKAASYSVGTDVRKMIPTLRTVLMSEESYDQFLLQEVDYAGQRMSRKDAWGRLDEAGLTGGGFTTEVSRMMGDTPTPTLPSFIPFVGKWYEKLQTEVERRQFDMLIPALKHEVTAELVAHKLRTGRGKRMGLEAVEREAAVDINTTMGGLNQIAMGRSKTVQDILALVAIAPDWAESRLRLGGGAFVPGANNATNRRFMARVMVAGAIFTVAGSYAYARERGWDDEQTLKYIRENLSPVKERDGKIMINGHFMEYQMAGSGQWTSLLSWEKDVWRVLFGMYALATGDRGGFDLTAGGYIVARAGVIPRLGTDAIFNRNYSGQPITTNTGFRGFADWLAYEFTQSAVPSFGSGLLQATVPDYPGGTQTIQGALHNASGFGRSRTLSATDTIDRLVQDEQIPRYDENGRQTGTYMAYRDLPNDIKGEFDKRHPGEAQAVVDAREARGRDTFDVLRRDTASGLAELAPLAETDKPLYREQVADFVGKQMAVMQNELKQLAEDGVEFSERKGDQGLLDRYFKAVAPATNQKTYVIDFDEHDKLEDNFRAGLTPHERQRLDEMLVYTTDPTYQELKKDKQYLRDSGYFARVDKAWGEFHAELKKGTGDPGFDASIPTWESPDDMKAYLKKRIVEEGQPEFYWDAIPIQGKWETYLTNQTAALRNSDPKMDGIILKWGYGSRPKTQEAYDAARP